MEQCLSDEELNFAEECFSKSTQEKWHFHCMREEQIQTTYRLKDPFDPKSIVSMQNKIDPRFDIYIGTPISDNELRNGQLNLMKNKVRSQIAHFHKVSPEIYFNNPNYQNDGSFCVMAHDLFPKMIAELKRLKGENNGNKI